MKSSLTLLIAFLSILTFGVRLGAGQETPPSIIVGSPSAFIPSSTYTVDNVIPHPVPASSYGWFGGGGNGMHLLNDPSVMKDLELVDEQRERLSDVRKCFGNSSRK